MSKKRFIWKTEKLQHSDDEVIMVVDNANKEWKGHVLNIVDMLNELNDERMMYKTTIDKRIVELEEENEQLKQQLLYDGDDVCGICKHEYLTPSGDYFISKCEKGHEECSKEDKKYCEDFKLKEAE